MSPDKIGVFMKLKVDYMRNSNAETRTGQLKILNKAKPDSDNDIWTHL